MESRKKRLRRLSQQVAAGILHSAICTQETPSELQNVASAYERGYKQAMRDLRRELAEVPSSDSLDAFGLHREVVRKFLGGVR